MTPNKVLRMAVAAAAAIGTVHADTDARMSVVATCNPGPNTITFPVADTTGLFDDNAICFSIRGGDFGSGPATDYLIRNGFGFPNDGCVLHIWQDDDCTVEAGTVGPLIQVDGKLQGPFGCLRPTDPSTGIRVTAQGMTLSC